MLTAEQQAALSGTRPQDLAYRPPLPPSSGSTFRPFPGEMGRPGYILPPQPSTNSISNNGLNGLADNFLLIAILGMLG